MYVCMDWAVDTTDLTLELTLESAQEYQDNEFKDKLSLSDPTYPLLRQSLIQ